MIPYFKVDQFTLGPIIFHVWGIFMALGIILGTLVAIKRANKYGIVSANVVNLVFLLTLSAFIGGKIAFVLFSGDIYVPGNKYQLESGFSSLGAIVAGIIVTYLFAHTKKISMNALISIFGPALLLADAVGRIGCFLIHEHLGTQSGFILAVNINGTSRHDLGLYYFLTSLLGFVVITKIERWQNFSSGIIGSLSVMWYMVFRFLMEFLLEKNGPLAVYKYFGLTLMQYLSLFVLLVIILWVYKKMPHHAGNDTAT